MKISYKILIAGVDAGDARFIREALSGVAAEVVVASAAEASRAAGADVDLVVLGEEPDRGSAFAAMKTLREGAAALVPVILLASDDDARSAAMEAGFADMIVRPLDIDGISTKIETALRLSTHRAALDEKAKTDNLLDALEDGIAILDGDLKVVRLNDRARAFLAVPAGAAGAEFTALLRNIFKIKYDGALEKDLPAKALVFDVERPETDRLRPLVLEVRTSVARDSFRRTTAVIALLADVTERRRRAFQEESFLNLISHKLRTPLAIVDKNAELVSKKVLGPLNADQEKFMKALYEKTRELVDSFEKLLGFTLIKSKALDLSPEDVPLDDYLPPLLEAAAKRRKMDWKIEGEKGLVVRLHPKYVDMTVKNILENAVKFSDKDPVKVRVKTRRDGDRVAIDVVDDGPGIPPEDLEKIFEPFYQVDKDRTLNVAGTGLGLAIARRIVAATGGTLEVKSELGKGSTFTFSLPSK